jgi:FkbM family methyltransferase
MSQIKIEIAGGWQPCAIVLDLDPALPNELFVLNHVANGQFYEPDLSHVFLRLLRDGDTVIDVGANAGYFSMLAAALVGATGNVISFEPDPANCKRLLHNISLNGFNNISLVDRPALDNARAVGFFINHDSSGGDALWDVAKWPLTQKAPEIISLQGTTVDAEISRLGLTPVKLIKIDAEGADHMVLQGAFNLLSSGTVPFIVCELHDFALNQMGTSPRAMREYIEGLGYESFMLFNNGTLPHMVPRGTSIQYDYICNILFALPGTLAKYWPIYHHDPAR